MALHGPRLLYEILEGPMHRHPWARTVQTFLLLTIIVSVIAVCLETVPKLGQNYAGIFHAIELITVFVFTVEYGARLWLCVYSPRISYQRPLRGRLRYSLSLYALIDLGGILPSYIALFSTHDVGFLIAVRLLRVFKLARFSPAMSMLGRVIYGERKALGGCVIIILILLVLSSSVVYYVEREAQPQVFSSIPATMWWALAALTTVGYGDMTPITPLGRVVGGFVTLLGVGMFALPAGILASGFAEEIKKRDFVVTWTLVSQVPFFSHLIAPRIAEIAQRLRPRIVEPGETVVRKGESAYSMYFIAAGEVEVALHPHPIRLKGGQFFGEMALLGKSRRSATVVAVTECRLLELDSEDFEDLMETDAELRETIARTARERAEELEHHRREHAKVHGQDAAAEAASTEAEPPTGQNHGRSHASLRRNGKPSK